MEPSDPAGRPDRDLLFAWALASSADVGAFPEADEEAARRAISDHPQPVRIRGLVEMLVDTMEASPARLQAVADSARARHHELAAQREPPEVTHPYLVAIALADCGLRVIEEGEVVSPATGGPHPGPAPAEEECPADDRKLAWVMRLPQIDPPFTEDQRWRDGCMMPPLTWLQRLRRQLFPRHELRDCCHYHGQDFHAIATVVNSAYPQLRRSDLYGDDLDELRYQLVREARLSDDERTTALLLLDEHCGIRIHRPAGERHWTYTEGRHRARALMDAGVRRILITATDDRRSRD